METLKQNIENAGVDARYDECCKKLLSNKKILAWILKYSASEYKDCSLEQIAAFIEGEPQIGTAMMDAGATASSVRGRNTEDSVINEGKITYDLRFDALAPGADGEVIQLIINVEAQNAFKPSYPLLKRAVYYCSRMISAQKGMEFGKSEYNKIKKVYSIWVCANPPIKYRDTITRYKLCEENLIGSVREDILNYDLINIVMICLGDGQNRSDDVLGLLETLLSETMDAERKIRILDQEYNMKLSEGAETEVLGEMCNLSEGVYNKGIEKGMEKGIEKGMEKGRESALLESIKKIMAGMGITVDKAMDVLEIPEEKRAEYLELLKK